MASYIGVIQGLPRKTYIFLARSIIRNIPKVLDAAVISQVELIVLDFRLLIVFGADNKRVHGATHVLQLFPLFLRNGSWLSVYQKAGYGQFHEVVVLTELCVLLFHWHLFSLALISGTAMSHLMRVLEEEKLGVPSAL